MRVRTVVFLGLAVVLAACLEQAPAPVVYKGPETVPVRVGALPPKPQLKHPPPFEPRAGPTTVVVQKGDTVYAVAQGHRVSVRSVIEANGLTPPYVLRVGQRLLVPRARIYEVRSGDTLFGIARRDGLSASGLARINGLQPSYRLVVGQQLVLPWAEALAPGTRVAGEKQTLALSAPAPAATSLGEAPMLSPSAQADGAFLWPIRGKVVSTFGPKPGGLHNDGINIAAPMGTPVRAAASGVVAYAGNELRGYGNLLLIRHAQGWVTAYAHNEVLLVERGDRVERGQIISRVGSTGGVAEPQSHFEIRRHRRAVDPLKYLVEN